MNIPNVVSGIRDLKVNAIHMEPNGNDSCTKFKNLVAKLILEHTIQRLHAFFL
jgi:hypothetical protein